MLLAGDIGGTKTLLGLFDVALPRPGAIAVESFTTLEHDDLASIVRAFISDRVQAGARIEAACFGVAGPVIDNAAQLTNVPWRIEGRRIAESFAVDQVDLLNDLEAMAYGVTVLNTSEVHVLQDGEPARSGNIGLIAAGTGLGIAMLHQVDGRYVPVASEGGHADFAARTDREISLLRWLTGRYGRAEVEAVVSGRGLLNIYQVTHVTPCASVPDLANPDAAAQITAAGLDGGCPGCVEALEVFVEAYGAEAGNLAVRTVSTGGMFVGGGIAAKILPALTRGRFVRAFRSKAPLDALLGSMPVKVILNPQTGLLGAAVYACQRLK
jgi:glucokinase